MNPIVRRLLGAAASAVARKLLPDSVPDNPGTALARRSTAALAPIVESRSNLLPTVRPSQILYAPPVQPMAAPAPPARRRRKVVVTETVTYEEREW